MQDEVPGHSISLGSALRTQKCRTYTTLREDILGWRRSTGEMRNCCSVLVFFRHRLDLPYSPGAVTSLPLQSFNLPQKLGRECRFVPETFISRVAAETQVHITGSRLQGASENTQLLFVQFEQHRRASTLATVGPVKRLTRAPFTALTTPLEGTNYPFTTVKGTMSTVWLVSSATSMTILLKAPDGRSSHRWQSSRATFTTSLRAS